MVQTIRDQIKACKVQIGKNSGITIKADSVLSSQLELPRHAGWQCTRFHKRQDSTTTANEKIRHMSYQSPLLFVGEAVACRRPGALVNKLESTWFEGIWLGRDSKTDEHLIGTPNGMVRSRALKRRVERRHWDKILLNVMIWDPWKQTPVTRGRPLKVRSDREPILMGPIPRLQVNPPDDLDTVATASTSCIESGNRVGNDDTICCRTNTREIARVRSRGSTTGAENENNTNSFGDDHS